MCLLPSLILEQGLDCGSLPCWAAVVTAALSRFFSRFGMTKLSMFCARFRVTSLGASKRTAHLESGQGVGLPTLHGSACSCFINTVVVHSFCCRTNTLWLRVWSLCREETCHVASVSQEKERIEAKFPMRLF